MMKKPGVAQAGALRHTRSQAVFRLPTVGWRQVCHSDQDDKETRFNSWFHQAVLILMSTHPESNLQPSTWWLLKSFTKIPFQATRLYIYKLIILPYPQLRCWQNPPKLNSDYLHFLSHPWVLHGFASYTFKKPVIDTVFSSAADGNIYIWCSEALLYSHSRELTLPNLCEHFSPWAIPPLEETAKLAVCKYLY